MRVGLKPAMAPTCASRIRFETAVGATDAANRNLLTCTGRDHRIHEAKSRLYRFDNTQDPMLARA